MTSRRQFFRIILGFFSTILAIKYSKIINAMSSQPYHHLPDGTFQNPVGSPVRLITKPANSPSFFSFFYKTIFKKEIFGQKEIPEFIPSNHQIDEQTALKQFYNNKNLISITWLGHAAFIIKVGKLNILTDPFLSDTAGVFGVGPSRFAPPGIKVKNLPKIDIILISHNHYDHLDITTLKNLNNKKNITLICPLQLSKTFTKIGFNKVVELDWFAKHTDELLTITSVPSIHWSRRLGQKRNSTLWSGYTISYGNKNIYFSGDTAFGPVFNEIGKKLGPFDLTIISIGAYEPRDFMKTSHCNPEEAVRITKMLGSKNILGMHWGTIRLSAENAWEPPKKFFKTAKLEGYKDHQIWQMPIGQTKSL